MRKIIILLFTLFLSINNYAQKVPRANNCKFMMDEIDDFTGERSKLTNQYQLSKKAFANKSIHIYAFEVGEYIGINLFMMYTLNESYKVTAGDDILFLNEEDEIFEFKILETKYSEWSQLQGHNLSINLVLDEEDIDILKTEKFKKIRIPTSIGNFDFDIIDKSKNNFKILLDCLK